MHGWCENLSDFGLGNLATLDDDDGGGDGGGVVLVACSADEFTCHNGRCVPRSRCNDGIDDCWDNSDETSCGIIINIHEFISLKQQGRHLKK